MVWGICCNSGLILPHDVQRDFCFEKNPAQSWKCPAQYFATIQLGILGAQQNKPQPKIPIFLFSTIFQSFIIEKFIKNNFLDEIHYFFFG